MQTLLSFPHTRWQESFSKAEQHEAIDAVEGGKILFFPHLPFQLEVYEKAFLDPAYLAPKSKNISYVSKTKTLKGVQASEADLQRLQSMMQRFATASQTLIEQAFPEYRTHLIIGRTSFRPAAVSNRQVSYRKDDRLLHVDAFPATPTHGLRILRVFSNVNPRGEPRIWNIGEDFETVAKTFLPKIPKPFPSKHTLMSLLKLTKTKRSLYDHYMMEIHNRMKGDAVYQKHAIQERLELPADSTWIVQTDQVSHAALAGQFMLEQTFYLPVEAMATPERSPLQILENLLIRKLI